MSSEIVISLYREIFPSDRVLHVPIRPPLHSCFPNPYRKERMSSKSLAAELITQRPFASRSPRAHANLRYEFTIRTQELICFQQKSRIRTQEFQRFCPEKAWFFTPKRLVF